MNDSLDEAIHYLEEAESKLDRLLAKGSESVSDTDRYELEVVRVDIEARKAEAKRSTYAAASGVTGTDEYAQGHSRSTWIIGFCKARKPIRL